MTAMKSPGALAAHGASDIDGLGRRVVSQTNRQELLSQAPIRATLIGSHRSDAEGISARGCAPVLDLCRELLAAGFNSASPLEAWRGEILCLRVRSIGEGARLTVADDRHGTPRLRRQHKRPQGYVAGSPVAENANGREVPPTAAAANTTTTGMATAAGMPTPATSGTATTATSGMAATAAFEGSGGVGQPATQEAAP